MADGRVIIEALLDTTNVTRNVANLGRQLNGISWKNLAAGDEKARALAAAFTGVGVAATAKLTLPILAAGAGALKMGSDFEDAMAKVSTIADTTEVPMGDLREAILKLSDDTGVAATDIADNVYNAISAGQKTGDAVAFVGNAAKLAKAGFTDSASALDVLTTTMNAYKLEADQTTRVSDVLLMTQNKGKTTVGELAATMGKAIPTAAAFGVNLENLAAAYATTTASGIATAESTTYINAMIKELGDTGSDVGKILQDKTGKSFAELMDSGMSLGDALSIVADAGEASNKTMFDMFGSAEAASAAAVIASDGASQFAGNLDAMNGAAGATDEAFGKMQTTSYDVDKAINRVKNAAIELGGQLLQALGPAIDAVGGAVEGATKWFSELDADGRNTVIAIGLVVAAIGPLLALIGGLIGKIDRIVSISKSAAGRIGKVGRALDGLAGSAKDAAKASGDYAGKAKDAAKEATAQEGATKKASAAMGLAKGAAVGLALAGIALIIDQAMKYVKKQQDFKKATEGMSDALDAMNQSYLRSRGAAAVADDASKNYAKSLSEVSGEVDDAIRKQADLADSIKQTFSEAGTKVGQLDSYKASIEELAGRSDLTTQKQAELRTAIDRVNGIAGTNYDVVQNAAGAYVIMKDGVEKAKDEVLKLIDAQQLQIRLDAINSSVGDQYKAQMDSAKALADAQAALNRAKERYDKVSERARPGDRADLALKNQANDELRKAQDAYDRINGTYSESTKSMSRLTDQQKLLTQAQSDGASAQEKFVADNDYLIAALQGSNKSCLDFASTLQGVGADTAKLGTLSTEQLTKLAQDYNGTYASIAGDLQEFGVHVDDSKAKAQEAFDGIRHSATLAAPEVRTAFVNAGTDVDAFAKKLADAGVSTEAFNSLTADQLADLVQNYGGNIDLIKPKLDEFVQMNKTAGKDGGDGIGAGYSSAIGSHAGEASAQAATVAGSATAGLGTGDPSSGGVLGGSFAALVGGQADNAAVQGTGVAGGATAGLGTGDPSSGSTLGASYASGVGGQAGSAITSGRLVASGASDGLRSQNGNAGGWGGHLVQNFADGIRGAIDWVTSAASSVASAVAGIFGHTIPKEGPLRNRGRGEAEWGAHAVQNFAKGMRSSVPEVEGAISAVARAAGRGFSGISAEAAGISFRDADVRYASPGAMRAVAPAGARIAPGEARGQTPTTVNYSFVGDIIIKCDDVDQVRDMGELARAIMRKGGLR